MEMPIRRHKTLQDQENLVSRNVNGKAGLGGGGLKARGGLTQRGVLGDLSNNLPARNVDITGKIAATAAEFEKKATINRSTLRSTTYKHVQSKVDTGLAGKPAGGQVPSARPPLRREDSTTLQKARLINNKTKAITVFSEKTHSKESTEVDKTVKCEKKSIDNKAKIARPVFTRNSKEELEPVSVHLDEQTSPKLPPNVEDVDAGDDNSPLLLSIYIKDIYRYLREMEQKYSIEPNFLRNQVAVNGRMRATLIDWLVEVQRQFNLLLETFQMTVGIIDRYLQVKEDVPRNKLQLVGVTALFIASKYEEIYSPDVDDFVYVTDHAYRKQDIFKCERDIMQKLGFCLGRPLPLHFIRRFIKVAEGNAHNHHLAKYFVDLCLLEYSMAHYRPSELAAAAMCLSLLLLPEGSRTMEEIWNPTLEYYSGYTLPHLKPIISQIARVVRAQETSRLKAVQQRYREPALASVAALPVLRSGLIQQLARSPPASPHQR